MRFPELGGALIALAFLAGCGCGPEPGSGPNRGGRYLGIGIYPAGDLWSRMAAADRPAGAAAANRADDGQIIVVVDSRTGEVRQCGNLTGYCITMNPWSGPLRREQSAPVGLTEHAADLARAAAQEIQAAADEATPPPRRRR